MPAAAHANAFDDALKEYRTTGAVDGCKYTAAELAQAKAQTPKDIAQTAPGFPAQLAVAAAQAREGLHQGTRRRPASTATAAAPPATTTTARGRHPAAGGRSDDRDRRRRSRRRHSDDDRGARAGAGAGDRHHVRSRSHDGAPVALVVVGALVLLLLVLWAFARWWAWEPRWLVRWRHATAEAGWRASAAWAEFTDWLRLGR